MPIALGLSPIFNNQNASPVLSTALAATQKARTMGDAEYDGLAREFSGSARIIWVGGRAISFSDLPDGDSLDGAGKIGVGRQVFARIRDAMAGALRVHSPHLSEDQIGVIASEAAAQFLVNGGVMGADWDALNVFGSDPEMSRGVGLSRVSRFDYQVTPTSDGLIIHKRSVYDSYLKLADDGAQTHVMFEDSPALVVDYRVAVTAGRNTGKEGATVTPIDLTFETPSKELQGELMATSPTLLDKIVAFFEKLFGIEHIHTELGCRSEAVEMTAPPSVHAPKTGDSEKNYCPVELRGMDSVISFTNVDFLAARGVTSHDKEVVKGNRTDTIDPSVRDAVSNFTDAAVIDSQGNSKLSLQCALDQFKLDFPRGFRDYKINGVPICDLYGIHPKESSPRPDNGDAAALKQYDLETAKTNHDIVLLRSKFLERVVTLASDENGLFDESLAAALLYSLSQDVGNTAHIALTAQANGAVLTGIIGSSARTSRTYDLIVIDDKPTQLIYSTSTTAGSVQTNSRGAILVHVGRRAMPLPIGTTVETRSVYGFADRKYPCLAPLVGFSLKMPDIAKKMIDESQGVKR